ncbi:MAG: cyclic nucleotide-binding domain-containing protein [Desulfobacteraceae bacterium]|nr:cyclic nucleotide-binding domain-containing protein [Desulfobacteraceae bacterium]
METNDNTSHNDPELIKRILPYAKKRRIPEGDNLIHTGMEADYFYYVNKGVFEVSYTAKQTPIVVALIGVGAFIGEIGFFDGKSRTRNIRALSESELSVFDRLAMARMQSEDAVLYVHFLEYILRSICGRFRQVLSDRGPLAAYAAALTTGKEHFKGVKTLPADVLGSPLWQRITSDLNDFRAGMFDVAYRIQQDPGMEISPDLSEQGENLLNQVTHTIRRYGPEIDKNTNSDLMWGYIFKEIFPYIMRSRFAERAYYKPKGYAGDYLLIDWIYQNEPKGDGKLGYLIDKWMLQQVAPRAVRSRRGLLIRLIDDFAQEVLESTDNIRIMNLASGPARELFDIITGKPYGDRINAVCVDIDSEALEYADQKVNTIPHNATVRFMQENVIKWALGRARHDFGEQDIIYSSGLCDYLSDRVVSTLIEKCYHQLAPGGRLMIGNFSPVNPDRYHMDQVLYWRLIHRAPEELIQLFSESAFGGDIEIMSEDEGVNLFAIARRAS